MFLRAIYTLSLLIAAPFLLFGLYKSKPNKPKFGTRWKEHFGIVPPLEDKNNPLWIHAVSVGECLAAIPLIKELKLQNPEQTIVVTTTTSTGAEQIAKLGSLIEHRYMPIDFSFAIRKFIRSIHPEKLLIIETELWPNTLHEVNRSGIPIVVINARLSEKSYRRYNRIRPLFKQLQSNLSQVLCQSQADATRFSLLGINDKKLYVTGSIKFDIQVSNETIRLSQQLRDELGRERLIWIAVSTHRGEDEQVLAAHKLILSQKPDALLIIVPRHPERFNDVFNLCSTQGFNCVRRTATPKVNIKTQVYIGDTMGEMFILLGSSDMCFMGGSWAGKEVGGHNVLEPAALELPIFIGPNYYNFQEIADKLIDIDALTVVENSNSLAKEVIKISTIAYKNKRLSSFIKENQGSIKNTIWALTNS